MYYFSYKYDKQMNKTNMVVLEIYCVPVISIVWKMPNICIWKKEYILHMFFLSPVVRILHQISNANLLAPYEWNLEICH